VRAAPGQPGLLVVDSSFDVVACNDEALRIFCYPESPEKITQVNSYLTNKIRAELVDTQSPSQIAEYFRSAKRTYHCRSFSLALKASHSNGSGTPKASGLLIFILQRRSNIAAKITEVSQRFGLTAREKETVQNLLEGLTSKEIAQRMNISPNTVKAFLRLTMVKMNVSTRSGIIGRIIGEP
jgi:DNA-binding CsgD family transcriptional regulator